MTRDEYLTRYDNIVELAVAAAKKATAEGILSLEDDLHDIQLKLKEISENGICSIVKKLEDTIRQKSLKKGNDFSKIDYDELPKLYRALWNFRYSMKKNKLSKKIIIKDEKDLFEYGLYLVCNGESDTAIERKLTKKIKHEKDRFIHTLELHTLGIVLLICRGTGAEELKDMSELYFIPAGLDK
jgi:flagellar motor component MotA